MNGDAATMDYTECMYNYKKYIVMQYPSVRTACNFRFIIHLRCYWKLVEISALINAAVRKPSMSNQKLRIFSIIIVKRQLRPRQMNM